MWPQYGRRISGPRKSRSESGQPPTRCGSCGWGNYNRSIQRPSSTPPGPSPSGFRDLPYGASACRASSGRFSPCDGRSTA